MNANEEIQSKLGEVRDRIRRVQLTRGVLVTATIALGGLLLIMAADYIFAPLPGLARWALFFLWIGATLYAAKAGFAPFFKKIGLVQIARWIEVRHPEMQERMSTVLEIAKRESSASSGLVEALGLAAHHDIETLNPDLEIKSTATKKKWARPAMALAAVLILVLVIWPSQSGRLLVRAVAPFSDLGNAGAASFEIEPGNIEVLEGDPVKITIKHDGPAKTIDLWIEQEGKKAFPQTLTRSGKIFSYNLDPALNSFRYYAQSGRSQSDAFNVTVWPIPEMLEPRLVFDYREYTGLSGSSVPLGNGIEEVEGTMVSLSSATNTALDAAWVEVDGVRLSDAKLETSSTGGRIAFAWRLSRENAGLAVITAKHHLGRELELARFPIEVLPDIDPQVVLTSPSPEEIKVRYDERVSLRYEVSEDFAVSEVVVEIDAGGDRKTAFAQDLPLRRSGNAKPAVFDGVATIAVGKIRETFPGANEARVRVTATDNRPEDLSEGPGVGSSRWLTLKFDQGAESLARQELREEHEGAKEKIEEAIKEAREAKDELASLRDEVKKEEMEDWAQEKFEKANKKLADAQEKVEELAAQMDDSIHASKAEKVDKAAEKLEEALVKAESAPLQDTPEARQEVLDEAKKDAEEAIKNLEEVRDKINEDQQRVEDLAKMQELAQKQEELARQAEENLNLPMTEEQLAEWKKQQEEMERLLAEQLKNRPEALAEALAEQAKQAEQLAQDAGELAENQAELQQQAQEQAQPEPVSNEALAEAIKQALAEEQQAIANEAQSQLDKALADQSEIADTLPEATSAANDALSELQQNDPAAAAESAEQAAQAMNDSAEQAAPTPPAQAAAEAAQEAADAQKKSAEAAQAAAQAETQAAQSGTPEAAEAAAQAADNAEAAAEQASEASEAAEAAAAQAGEPSEPAQAAAEAASKAETAAEAAAEAANAAEQAASGEPAEAKAASEAAATAETAAAEAAQAAADAATASAEAAAAQAAEMAANGESGSDAPAPSPTDAAQAEALSDLSDRQEQVAEALGQLAEGNLTEALEAVQAMQADAAAELADNLAALPQIDPTGAMQQAAQTSEQAAQSAESAAEQAAQGQQAAAAPQHGQASQQLAQTAEQLAQAAQNLAAAAEAAAAQAANPQQAPVSPADLAAAAAQAAQAAAPSAQPAEAAQAAAQAAQSMAQAAQAAQAQMSGMPTPPGPPGMPGPPAPGMPGEQPSDDPSRPAQPDPGVPPELAKLGISASDWEKIQASMTKDVGGAGIEGVPSEYRGLVKGYFQSMSSK